MEVIKKFWWEMWDQRRRPSDLHNEVIKLRQKVNELVETLNKVISILDTSDLKQLPKDVISARTDAHKSFLDS